MIYPILFFLAALIFGVCLTWMVRYYALKNNIVNKPNPIVPQHVKPIAYLGGVGIMAGGIIVIICVSQFPVMFGHLHKPFSPVVPLIIGAVGYLAWGVYDDLTQLKPLPKFLGQLALAVLCAGLGLHTSLFNLLPADFLFSVFWILLVVNAVNFTDVCDGLVGTICVITFFIIGALVPHLRIFCFLISGATMGFLFFNLPRASIFLGDAGSHLLGFLLAAIGIFGCQDAAITNDSIWLLLVTSVPLFELVFITSIRIYKGKPWWKGSPDHFSLRLQKGGFTRMQVNIFAGALSAMAVSVACLFSAFAGWLQLMSLLIIVTLYAVAWKLLLKWDVEQAA